MAELIGELVSALDGVQHCRMGGIGGVVFDLHPVARERLPHAWHQLHAGKIETIEHGKWRLLVRRPHVGEHHPGKHVHRIGGLAHGLPQPIRMQLPRHLQNRAVGIEQAAVVTAPESFVGDQAEFEPTYPGDEQCHEVQDPDIAASVPEHHQLLRQ